MALNPADTASAPNLDQAGRDLLARARRAVLATIAPDGRPRLVPVCYWLAPEPDASGHPLLYSPLDEKPKASGDVRSLARVRDLLARPRVSLLVDRWDEDWEGLAWLRLDGQATLLEPEAGAAAEAGAEHAAAVSGLRDRYRQYRHQALEARPLIRVAVDRVQGWSAAG
ncbi:MAG: TIGR03668 family PPOX class F420-dependent oxidoreductase [Candidatus Limnocylindrales bacterium]